MEPKAASHLARVKNCKVKAMLRIYIPDEGECVLSSAPEEFAERFAEAIRESARCERTADVDACDIVIINQRWDFRNWRSIATIESCEFLALHSSKALTISHDDVSTTFLPGLYSSLTRRNARKDWAIPCGYKRQYRRTVSCESLQSAAGAKPRWLFSFRGAEFSHPIRKKLARLYAGQRSEQFSFVILDKEFHSHSDADHLKYINEMIDSQFVLAPRGFSPATYRLFEAMQYGRCPVIISDDWQPIGGIDWESCSIRVAESDIANLPEILAERADQAEELGRRARESWEGSFADGVREKKMLAMLLDLNRACTRSRDIESLRRFWRSKEFFRAHGWTIVQRAARRLRAGLERVG